MGCWNKTCGLSNLHITWQTPVYVFVLERMSSYHDQCYSTFLYRPLLLPFYSEYNDYGAGENSSGPFLDLMMDSLKNKLIEVEQGKNQYHDIAVKRDAWDEKLFWDAIHENRLKIKSYSNKGETPVDVVMFRKDIVDQIFMTWKVETYSKSGYKHHTVDDLLKEIPLAIERAKAELARWGSDIGPLMVKFEVLFKWDEDLIINRWLANDHRYSRIVEIEQLFFELVTKGDEIQAALLLGEHLKAKWLDAFMSRVRKLWSPGGFEGSQSQDPNGYRVLTQAINNVLDWADSEE